MSGPIFRQEEDIEKRYVYRLFVKNNFENFSKTAMMGMLITEHPKIIQDRIKNLTKNKLGYSGFNNLDKSKYYE